MKISSARLGRVLVLGLLCASPAHGQGSYRTENVLLITIDGLRWREVFTGADSTMLGKASFVAPHVQEAAIRFQRGSPEVRRQTLMPFLWSVFGRDGQIYGNRALGCTVDVTNNHWFSYPGYNEIFTGRADDENIKSNGKALNPNVTVLEFAHAQPAFRGRVASIASWDVFPYILNEERSGIPVNAGFDVATGKDLSEKERILNELLGSIPPLHPSRPDAFTHGYAMEYLRRHRPRLLHIGYGEIDQFAHVKNYEAYLKAANDLDRFLRELWTFAQSHPQYRGKTSMVIVTDHGRGEGEKWSDHNRRTEHSNEIWTAILGPDTPARGEVGTCGLHQNQIARTVGALLGLGYTGQAGTGEPIAAALRP